MKHAVAILLGMLGAGCPDGKREPDGEREPTGEAPPGVVEEVDDGFTAPVRLDDAVVRSTEPGNFTGPPRPCRPPELVRVRRVIDGDTIDVEGDRGARERIRLIGVDTPELDHQGGRDECFARQATTFTERLDGRLVWLSFDHECHDRYNRVLAYVHVGPEARDLWERQLIRRGFAEALVIPPNDHFAQRLRQDEQVARGAAAGRWSHCR